MLMQIYKQLLEICKRVHHIIMSVGLLYRDIYELSPERGDGEVGLVTEYDVN